MLKRFVLGIFIVVAWVVVTLAAWLTPDRRRPLG